MGKFVKFQVLKDILKNQISFLYVLNINSMEVCSVDLYLKENQPNYQCNFSSFYQIKDSVKTDYNTISAISHRSQICLSIASICDFGPTSQS